MEKQPYYRKLQSKIYFLKRANMLFRYFEADDVKKHTRENIVPVIYMGACFIIMFTCTSSCFVWRNRKPIQSIDTSFASFSPLYKGVKEKGKEWRIKERPWHSGWIFFGIADSRKLDAITFLWWKIWSHSTSATGSYGRLAGWQAGRQALRQSDEIVLDLEIFKIIYRMKHSSFCYV